MIVFITKYTVCLQSGEIPQKVFPTFDDVYHVYLIKELQKSTRNLIHTMAFLRADQERAKKCCHMGWIGCSILQLAQTAIAGILP